MQAHILIAAGAVAKVHDAKTFKEIQVMDLATGFKLVLKDDGNTSFPSKLCTSV